MASRESGRITISLFTADTVKLVQVSAAVGRKCRQTKEKAISEYEMIASFQSLYDAHYQARKNKRYKQAVMAFETDLANNLWRIKEKMDARKYEVAGYHYFKVYDPKERDIQALAYPDRIVQHSLCDKVVGPTLEAHLIYDNAACRKGKGTSFAMDRLAGFMRKHHTKHGSEGYVLKADMTKYFVNINHEILKSRLTKVFKEGDIINLPDTIIDSHNKKEGRGLPMGNMTSQWFALLYLDCMERLIKEKLKIESYTRYMDDLILIHEDKEYLKYCPNEMAALAHELNLAFNSKTQVAPLKNGVEYVGWNFNLTKTGEVVKKVRSSTKKRVVKNMKGMARVYNRGHIDEDRIAQHFSSIFGCLA